MPDPHPSLGGTIRARRRELGLTQEELAARIGAGVRQGEVSRLETGRVALPGRRRLEAIAAALELPVGALLLRSGWTADDAGSPPASLPPRYRIEHHRAGLAVLVLAWADTPAEASAVFDEQVARLRAGGDSGTVVLVDQASEPERWGGQRRLR